VIRKISIVACALAFCFAVAAFVVGSALVAPNPVIVTLPSDLAAAESVVFPSASGSIIHGWFLRGQPGSGAVLLLHGVKASRLAMADRARLLYRDGYSVLAIDFQANGESPGAHVTFGFLEALDAQAAVDFLKSHVPNERIGVVGASMGGAAAILAKPRLQVDAMILEEVYPTMVDAVDNRLRIRFGAIGPILSPALTLQLRPRLGISSDDLRPIAVVPSLDVPKHFIVGSDDQHTTLDQSQALFAAAAEPKELWIVDGAQHVDMCGYAGQAYADRVESFLAKWVRRQ